MSVESRAVVSGRSPPTDVLVNRDTTVHLLLDDCSLLLHRLSLLPLPLLHRAAARGVLLNRPDQVIPLQKTFPWASQFPRSKAKFLPLSSGLIIPLQPYSSLSSSLKWVPHCSLIDTNASLHCQRTFTLAVALLWPVFPSGLLLYFLQILN